MATDNLGTGRLPAAYLTPGSSSFADFLSDHAPDLLPGRRPLPGTVMTTEAPHGTTIVALTFPGGIVMAGDRRATMGNYIAQRDIEKVFHADDHSCVGIAGAAGIAIEMVRLFQVELEHYEKIEGATLSLEGKANRLAQMIRGNLAMAMQGLAVVPLFAGYDLDADDPVAAGRLFSYDVTGGRYEEQDYVATGSGSLHAGTVVKIGFRTGLSREDAVNLCLRALWEAADADSATGGPDPLRNIFPVVATISVAGFERVDDDELRNRFETIAREVRA